MEEKLDHILYRITATDTATTAIEGRVRNLEATSSRMIGMGGVVVLLASLLGSTLSIWIH